MRLLKPLLLALLMASPGLAQTIPAPQINLSGNIGCQGFPCLNNGILQLSTDANHTMTAQETGALAVNFTSSVSLTATRNMIYPAGRFGLDACNFTTGGQSIQIIGISGSGITITNGSCARVWNNGTNFLQMGPSGGGAGVTSLGATLPLQVNTSTGPVTVSLTGCTTIVTFSSTPVFDLAQPCASRTLTLTGNVSSSTATNVIANLVYEIVFVQDATGGRTFVWPTNFKTTTTINLAANGRTRCFFTADADLNLYPNGACAWY